MKLVNYRCEECQEDYEELFQDTEEIPEELTEEACPKCGKLTLKIWNFKKNDQIWRFFS